MRACDEEINKKGTSEMLKKKKRKETLLICNTYLGSQF